MYLKPNGNQSYTTVGTFAPLHQDRGVVGTLIIWSYMCPSWCPPPACAIAAATPAPGSFRTFRRPHCAWPHRFLPVSPPSPFPACTPAKAESWTEKNRPTDYVHDATPRAETGCYSMKHRKGTLSATRYSTVSPRQ